MTNNELERQIHELRVSDTELQQETLSTKASTTATTTTKCPVVNHASGAGGCPFRFIPLKMGGNGGTHKHSSATRDLIHKEVSLQALQVMTEQFYQLAFQDDTLDKLIRSHKDPHGSRFAKWIHQKLAGSNVWDLDREARDLTPVRVAGRQTVVIHDRSSAHAAAWYSPKRPAEEVGRHFTLDECRVWMRLHFWAMRETGMIDKSPTFADYYVRFIGHFVAVYERKATQFARESFRWSANPSNIQQYLDNGRKMEDVLHGSYNKALRDLDESELKDHDWPYNTRQAEWQ
jgi:hypothetical protein